MDAGDYISALGILVSAFFSWRLYLVPKASAEATKKSATATDAATSLAVAAEQQRIQVAQSMRGQYLRIVKENADTVINQLLQIMQTDPKKFPSFVGGTPLAGIGTTELAAHFSPEEQTLIVNNWKLLDQFLNKYFENKGVNGFRLPHTFDLEDMAYKEELDTVWREFRALKNI